MRQGQQNRRGRGRSNNQQNRKGQNPLTRSFESTGPDVKIRGTPAHIAEKYIALARDAQSSGDPVLAENYLQHAEHYTRIIMAFREQQMSQGGDMGNGGTGRPRPGGFSDPAMSDDFSEDENADTAADLPSQGALLRGHEPQPRTFEGHQRFDDRQQRPAYDAGRHHHQPREHRERLGGGEQRGFADRPDRHQDRADRYPRQPERHERPHHAEQAHEGLQQSRRDRTVPHHEQPEFLRRPVRRPRREENGQAADEPAPVPSTAIDETGHD